MIPPVGGSYILGPWAAGLIMDNFNPNLLWYICGAVSVIPLTGFLMMYRSRTQ